MATSLPTNRWKLGLFVTLGFLGLVSTLGWLGAARLRRESTEAHYFFDQEVNGLELGSPVKFRGVTIGKVIGIRAAPDQRHVEVVGAIYTDALVSMGLSRDAHGPEDGPFVPDDLRVQLDTSLVTGAAFIQSDFFDPKLYPIPEYPFPIPWNTVHVVPSTYKSLEDALRVVAEHLPEMTEGLHQVLRNVERVLDELEVAKLSSQAQSLLRTAEDFVKNIEELSLLRDAGGTMEQMRATLAEIEGLAAELRSERGPLVRVADRLDALGEHIDLVLERSQLPETAATIREAGAGLGATGDEAAQLGLRLQGDLDELRATLTAVRRLAEMLERDPGALLRGRDATTIPELERR